MSFLLYPLLYFAFLTVQVIFGRPEAPHLLLIATCFLALRRGPVAGEVFGYLAGLGLDSFSPAGFGSQALGLALVGFLIGRISRRFHEGNPINQASLLFAAFLATHFLVRAQAWLFGWSPASGGWPGFLWGAITTAAAAPVLCFLLARLFERLHISLEVAR